MDTLIDHTWTNRPENILECKNLIRATADHNALQTIFRTKGQINGTQEMIKRWRTDFKVDEYQNMISLIDWEPLYQEQNINLAYDYLETKILEVST